MSWGIALFLVVGIPLFKKWIKKIKESSQSPLKNQTNPEAPIGFGYKTMWIAVKTNKQERIAETIGLHKFRPANWRDGINKAYKNAVLITPEIKGWTLAVGEKLPSGDSIESINQVKSLLIKLSQEFGEAQFFCTHRIVEYHCWVKASNGVIVRTYSYLGENAENIMIDGMPTEIEKKYNLINTFSPEAKNDEYFEREDIEYPNEELVMTIAEQWSINPTKIGEMNHIQGFGLIAT